METSYQGLASLVVEAQAMYETKGILEAQPYGSPAVEILGLPTPYRRPHIRPDPCLPGRSPKLPMIFPWPKPEKEGPEVPLILPGPEWPDELPVAVFYKQTQTYSPRG